MNRYAALLFLMFVAVMRTAAQDFRETWKQLITEGRDREVISSAARVYEHAVRTDDALADYAGIYLARAYMGLGQYDSVYYWLDLAEPGVTAGPDMELKVSMLNLKAALSITVEVNYAAAYTYFNQALEIARASGEKTQERRVLCNLAHLYGIREDSTGFSYAREAYELCKAADDLYALPSATILLADMYKLKDNYSEAMRYALELKDLAGSMRDSSWLQMACQLTASIYEATGDYEAARRDYEAALAMNDKVEGPSARVGIFLLYGNFLQSIGEPQAARKMYEQGLLMSSGKGAVGNVGAFLQGLSEVCGQVGDSAAAYEYYRQYDEIEQVEKQSERDFNRLYLRFTTIQHQKEISEGELELMKANRRFFIGGLLLVVLAVIAAVLFYLYKKKNRMYRQLVENHYRMSAVLEQLREENSAGQQVHAADTGELYFRIEALMMQDKLYRRSDISLDMLAAMLKTNRAYVSKEINAHGGMTFYNYINHYRIAEAVDILQDENNDVPLKALCSDLGFNSMSVFYRSFQKETGVPPSRYREEMRRIKREEKEQ